MWSTAGVGIFAVCVCFGKSAVTFRYDLGLGRILYENWSTEKLHMKFNALPFSAKLDFPNSAWKMEFRASEVWNVRTPNSLLQDVCMYLVISMAPLCMWCMCVTHSWPACRAYGNTAGAICVVTLLYLMVCVPICDDPSNYVIFITRFFTSY